ncbi:MAG: fumarylacetoacetate hydrolase family protein [Ignavibacteriae bacterium]|nr:FAA hydrolase family protein [Ignavibacteriota bacterium]NOG97736.1 fumarylacetoacetate hydrolase family protein [Ignavibacteriota bacterium]
MKLIRVGKPGFEKSGIYLGDNKYIDASSYCKNYDEEFFNDNGLQKLKSWFENNKHEELLLSDDKRIGAPIARPSKIICIGLNFRKHAEESGAEPPKEPVVFFKATTAMCGPNDDLVIPRNSKKTDWEVELAFVIGKTAKYVSEKEALNYVAGYVLHNDYSEREFQLEKGGQWVKGKSADTFAPIGPYLVTPDEIDNVNNLNMWLKLNGDYKQQGNTNDFIFNVPQVISYLSNFMTLLPGDVISTGTPSGVGLGMKPPVYLKPGDVVELGIDGLGSSKQNVVASE